MRVAVIGGGINGAGIAWELARKDWLVCPAAVNFVFHPNPYEIWNLMVAEWNKANPLLPGMTGNPELN